MVLLHCRSVVERLLIPAFVFFFAMLYPFAWVNWPEHRIAAAAGGCMLMRRQTLERVGGLDAVRGDIVDDVALARAIKRSGGTIWLGLTRGTRSLRPYASAAEIWNIIGSASV